MDQYVFNPLTGEMDIAEVTKIEAAAFDGFLDREIEIVEVTTETTGGSVKYSRVNKTFVYDLKGVYYRSWMNVYDYLQSVTLKPLTNKIFVYDGKQYMWNGAELVVSEFSNKIFLMPVVVEQPGEMEYYIYPDTRHIIQSISDNSTTELYLYNIPDDGYVHSYEIELTTGDTPNEILFHSDVSIAWIKDLEITPNTRYLICIDATSGNTYTALYTTIKTGE